MTEKELGEFLRKYAEGFRGLMEQAARECNSPQAVLALTHFLTVRLADAYAALCEHLEEEGEIQPHGRLQKIKGHLLEMRTKCVQEAHENAQDVSVETKH